jgi:hypothetical protein
MLAPQPVRVAREISQKQRRRPRALAPVTTIPEQIGVTVRDGDVWILQAHPVNNSSEKFDQRPSIRRR